MNSASVWVTRQFVIAINNLNSLKLTLISEMVESTDQAGFKPDEREQALILQHLGGDAIVDEKFKTTQTLSKE